MQHYLDEARAHRAQAKRAYMMVAAAAPAGEPLVIVYRTQYREACDAVCEAQRRMNALHQEAIDYDKLVALTQLWPGDHCRTCGQPLTAYEARVNPQECAQCRDEECEDGGCAECGSEVQFDGDSLCYECNELFEAQQDAAMRADLHRGSR